MDALWFIYRNGDAVHSINILFTLMLGNERDKIGYLVNDKKIIHFYQPCSLIKIVWTLWMVCLSLSFEIINHFINNKVITICLSDSIKKKVPMESFVSSNGACKLIDWFIPLLFKHLILTLYPKWILCKILINICLEIYTRRTYLKWYFFLCELFSTDV